MERLDPERVRRAVLEAGGYTGTLEAIGERVLGALGDGDATAAEVAAQVPELALKVVYAPDKPYGGTINLAGRVMDALGASGLGDEGGRGVVDGPEGLDGERLVLAQGLDDLRAERPAGGVALLPALDPLITGWQDRGRRLFERPDLEDAVAAEAERLRAALGGERVAARFPVPLSRELAR